MDNVPQLTVRFETAEAAWLELVANMSHGFVFVPGVAVTADLARCHVVLVYPGTEDTMTLPGRAVWVSSDGTLVQIAGFDKDLARRLKAFAKGDAAVAPEVSTDGSEGDAKDKGDEDRKALAANVHERLRGLSNAQQRKVARTGHLAERVALERIYGKAVWEALLSNNQLTAPEVARIAKMGNLPRPLIEQICSNARWVRSSVVRRALLSNPRLRGRSIMMVLNSLPQAELKVVPLQSAYTLRVRQEAKSLLAKKGLSKKTGR